jgi:hypothetical protein
VHEVVAFRDGGGGAARGIVLLDGVEQLALRPNHSAARGINPSISLRADLDVSDKSFVVEA